MNWKDVLKDKKVLAALIALTLAVVGVMSPDLRQIIIDIIHGI